VSVDVLADAVAQAERAGLAEAVAAVRAGIEPPAVRLWSEPSGARLVRQVRDVAELLALTERIVAGGFRSYEMEMVLDGLARLPAQWPEVLHLLARPLLAAVDQRLERVGRWGLSAHGDLVLLVAYLSGRPVPEPEPVVGALTPRHWLSGRIREVATAPPGPLLALPEDDEGWISPETLVHRAGWYEGRIVRRLDTAIALARLMPRGRSLARERAGELPGPLGEVVRAALGGDLPAVPAPSVHGPVLDMVLWARGWTPDGPPYRGESVGERELAYAPLWAATLWPGDHRWLWQAEPSASRAVSLLARSSEPAPPEAVRAVVREGAVDLLRRMIADARVGSAELAAALDGAPVALLAETAAASVLHRAVVRTALLLALPDRPPGEREEALRLLERLRVADRLPELSPAWPPEALAAALDARSGRA
jgi:hypothetical protein